MNVEQEIVKAMEAALEHFKKELKGLRTGRANPAIIENVPVEIYGTTLRLRELANITSPEPRQLLVAPFDPTNVQVIAKGIENANLNLQPRVEGQGIRIEFPRMTTQDRDLIVKECKDRIEKAKIALREIRRKQNQQIQESKKSGKIGEDEQRRLEKLVQEKTDKYCEKAEQLGKEKEKEILAI